MFNCIYHETSANLLEATLKLHVFHRPTVPIGGAVEAIPVDQAGAWALASLHSQTSAMEKGGLTFDIPISIGNVSDLSLRIV